MTKNSFLHPVGEVHFDSYDPKDVENAIDTTEESAELRLQKMLSVDDADRTFENTVLGLTRCSDEFDTVCSLTSHLESVLGEPWREVDILATKRYSEFANRIKFDKKIYEALKSVQAKELKLSPQETKLLTDLIEDYEKGGIALSEEKQVRLREIRNRLADLHTEFMQNCTKADELTGILIDTAEQLNGVEKEIIEDAKKAAEERGTTGYWVQYSEPVYLEVMSKCSDRTTRRAMYKAGKTIGNQANQPVAREILSLRQEMAEILGFNTYADYATSDRMAGTGQAAIDFLKTVESHYIPKVAEENAELEAFARELEGDKTLNLDMSDVDSGLDMYYAGKFYERKFDIDEAALRDYFPAEIVLEGMFKVLARLYGVKFIPTDGKKWHKDVEIYNIFDENDAHIAQVWCDWFARKGKRSGAWMNAIHTAERTDGAAIQPHLGYVVANLKPATSAKPSLLNMREIETIWHEFGHFMHFALGRVALKEQNMLDCEWDFIEAPSQIMENWVWQPEVMELISKHYQTGEIIPAELVEKVRRARQFRIASKTARQLVFGQSDLEIHINPDVDPDEISRAAKHRLYGIPAEDYDLGMMIFGHIFGGGYAAGYYSYKWAEAIEADFFEHIEKAGVLEPGTGREYRDKVLARGAEVKATDIVKDYLKRDSTIDAMLRRDGII